MLDKDIENKLKNIKNGPKKQKANEATTTTQDKWCHLISLKESWYCLLWRIFNYKDIWLLLYILSLNLV